MSATERLLSNINEYHNLLGFLNERYPKILNEWKLGTGPNHKPNTNSITRGINSNDRQQTEISSKHHINILSDFQDSLREIWKRRNRDWAVYSQEQFRRFWDTRTVEHRSK